MEEYLQYMKTLRSHMNDVEDQAAKISVEEQTLLTTIQTMETDLTSAKSETKKLKEDAELMTKVKGQVCSQILDKQRKIASLESDWSTLLQTLELIHRERVSLSAKLTEKGAYYTKVADDISFNLQQQKDWVNSHQVNGEVENDALSKKFDQKTVQIEGVFAIDDPPTTDNMGNDERKTVMEKLDCARSKLNENAEMKCRLASENAKVKQSIEQLKYRVKDFKPELVAMNVKNLEEEYQAHLSDKAGELEYLNSLQEQIKKIKAISHIIGCGCGAEYRVAMDPCP